MPILNNIVSRIDKDVALTANSDHRVASQKATKTYVDALAGAINALVYKGVINCAASPNYPAADAGYIYMVSVAGLIGGGAGPAVEAGDLLICKTDGSASNTHAVVGANWGIIQANLVPADYVTHALATTANDFLIASGPGVFAKQTLVQAQATLNPPRISSTASSATPIPIVSTTDIFILSALAITATFGIPSGAPTQGQPLIIKVKDNGVAKGLSWNGIYRAVGINLPATTTVSKVVYLAMLYNTTDTKWDVVGVSHEV